MRSRGEICWVEDEVGFVTGCDEEERVWIEAVEIVSFEGGILGWWK